MDVGDVPGGGAVTCATWIRRPENAHLVVVGKSKPCSIEIFSFDPKTTALLPSPKAKYELEEGVNPVTIAVHPSGDSIVCATSSGDWLEEKLRLCKMLGAEVCINYKKQDFCKNVKAETGEKDV